MIAVNNNSRILVTGTSLTDPFNAVGAWANRPGSLADQVRAQLTVAFSPAPSAFTYVPSRSGQTAPASYSPAAQLGRRQLVMTYGVGGRVVAGLASDLPASIYVWQPDVVIIEMTANDFGVTGVTAGGAYQTSYAAVLDGIRTNLPNAKVLCCNNTVHAETVSGGNFTDASNTWAGNTRIQELCNGTSTVGTFKTIYPQFCELVDVNTPALNFCIQYNTGGSTPRYLTPDNLHQTSAGGRLMAAACMSHLSFS